MQMHAPSIRVIAESLALPRPAEITGPTGRTVVPASRSQEDAAQRR